MQGRIKNIFLEKTVWIGIVAAASAIVAGSITGVGDMQVWQEQSVWKLLGEGLRSRILCFVIPVTAAVSGSDLYLRERQSGFLKFYVAREDKTRYQKEKNAQIFYSAAGIWIAAVFLAMIVFWLSGSEKILHIEWKESLREMKSAASLLLKAALICAAAAHLGAVCAIATKSLYLTMGIPFIAYYFLILLQERYFEATPWLSPVWWMTQNQIGVWIGLTAGVLAVRQLHGILLKRELCEI